MEIQRFSIHVFYLPLCLLCAPSHREPASEFTCRGEGLSRGREKDNNKKMSAGATLKEFINLPPIKCLMLITLLVSDILYFCAGKTTVPYSLV